MSIFLRGIRRSDGATVEVEHGSEGGVPSGEDSPIGVRTPTEKSELYRDKSNGALYMAVGLDNDQWVLVAGGADGPTSGIVSGLDEIGLLANGFGADSSSGNVGVSSGSGSNGGSAFMQGGAADGEGDGDGGVAWITAGTGFGTGAGGSIGITGGANGGSGTGNGGDVEIQGGSASGTGDGGSISLTPGISNDGEHGTIELLDHAGGKVIEIGAGVTELGFYGVTPVAQPAIAGLLSTITDDPTRSFITDIIEALAAVGIVANNTG